LCNPIKKLFCRSAVPQNQEWGVSHLTHPYPAPSPYRGATQVRGGGILFKKDLLLFFKRRSKEEKKAGSNVVFFRLDPKKTKMYTYIFCFI